MIPGRKRVIVRAMAVLLIVLVPVISTWWYTNTPEYKARRLVRELRAAVREDSPGPLQRLLISIGWAKPPQKLRPQETRRMRSELMALGKPAVHALIDALAEEHKGFREYVCRTLGDMGPVAVPPLAAALKDDNSKVRSGAADALGWMGREAEPAAPAIIQALGDESSEVRVEAAGALINIGLRMKASTPGLRAATPALLRCLANADGDVRGTAAAALACVDAPADQAVPPLIRAMEDQDGGVRSSAAWSLCAYGPQAVQAVPALVRGLRDEERGVRRAAVKALGKMGTPSREVVRALNRTLNDQDKLVPLDLQDKLIDKLIRLEAAASLVRLGRKHEGMPVLIRALRSKNDRDREEAARYLGALGSLGVDAVPALTQRLKDKRSYNRELAAQALGKIGPPAKAAIPALTKALKDECEPARKAAAGALKSQIRRGGKIQAAGATREAATTQPGGKQ